jgi:uncharacterized protein (TIGR02680 family)
MSVPARLPVTQSRRWQLLRAGIQNIWEYDDQRFVFHRGRLMLRGQNESGKTKALEVLLPFLLDASIQPHRLDPFGSTARPMRWNLLNDSNPSVTVAIGYVWLELGRVGDSGPEYWTLGAGLKARRTATAMDDWYFATSRRIDESLQLVVGSFPLTRAHLEAALGDEGTVFENAARYRRALNEKLFGLGQDQYGALVDALLQLRRPQLSKGLDPAELSRILSASLPPLDSEVIGALAEGFERLDRHRVERDERRATLESVRGFLDVYRQYSASAVKGRALEVTRADSAFHAARATQKEVEAKRDAALAALDEIEGRLVKLDSESIALDERLKVLRDSDAYRAVAELATAEQRAKSAEISAARATVAWGQGRVRADRKRKDVEEADARAGEDARELESKQRATKAAAGACGLAEAYGAVALALEEGRVETAHDALETTLRLRAEAIDALRKLTRQLEVAASAVEAAAARARLTEQRVASAAEATDRAASDEFTARTRLSEDVEAWVGACKELQIGAATLLDAPPEQMRPLALAAAEPVRAGLDSQLQSATLARDWVTRQLETTERQRAEVEQQRHQPPTAPGWRKDRETTRAGAPLYMLCDFAPDLEPGARAGLEAALEASSLLDAWVTPEGELLDAATFDTLLIARPAVEGSSLADVLQPVDGGAVTAERVQAVLESIGLGASSLAPVWVSADGRFALGPLEGRNGKSSPAFIGAAARERARQERLATLASEVTRLEALVAEGARTVDALQARRAALDHELADFPDLQPLREVQATLRARTEELDAARTTNREELERLTRADAVRAGAAHALDERAGEASLRGWIGRLDELVGHTAKWQGAVHTMLSTDDRARRSRADVETRRAEFADLSLEAERLEGAAKEEQQLAIEAHARAEALTATAGKDRDEILATLRETENRKREARDELEEHRKAQKVAQIDCTKMEAGIESAKERVREAESRRTDADARFRAVEGRGLLAVVGVSGPGPAHAWSWTDVLLTARRVDDATTKADASDAGRDKAWNRVSERHQELLRSLSAEMKVLASQADGLTVYEASFNARRLTLLELNAELEADLAARNRLLDDEERKLFESFLTGEAHEHLRERLREASSLVKKMNRQLDAHPTSSGMVMRLAWDVSEDAAPGTKEAVALLFKSGELMSDSDREALLGFLRQRLDEARAGGEAARSLQEQLLSVLDYRRWHTFEAQCRAGTEPWKRLTKKVHAAGSGGQKAVMLHLPLFAAAAAFYDSARPGAPRFILLDEAFAGIDRPTRGELMGLLADFDLDFVMTSFEEWGFYPQLDGLSTYHLAREKGMRGVYSDWFVWNGREQIQMPV